MVLFPCSKLVTESNEVSCEKKETVEQTETKQEENAWKDETKVSDLTDKYVLDNWHNENSKNNNSLFTFELVCTLALHC